MPMHQDRWLFEIASASSRNDIQVGAGIPIPAPARNADASREFPLLTFLRLLDLSPFIM